MKSLLLILISVFSLSASAFFSDQTPVMLADGSQREIATLGLGENLFGGARVSASVRKKTDTADILYSFNQSGVYFDAGQVFKTTTGYKAVDPARAALSYGDLKEIGTLAVGDELVGINGNVAIIALTQVNVEAGVRMYHVKATGANEFVVGGALAAGYRR